MIETTTELLACVEHQARVVAGAQERQSAAMARLWSARVAEELAAGASNGQAGEFVVTELAVALCATKGFVGDLLCIGLTLGERLPAVRAAWSAGELDLARVRVIVERTRAVSVEHVTEVERLLLERAGTTPGGRLGPVIDRIVGRIEPEAVFQRREEAVRGRRVVVSPAGDGMAEVWGRLPAVDGRVLDERLDAMARSVCDDDPRPHDARRADALTALAVGAELRCGCGCGTSGSPTTALAVQIIVTSDALLGGDEPAHLVGHGAVPRDTPVALADRASWLHGITDPASGALVGLGPPGAPVTDVLDARPHRYAVGAALARLVRLRDGHCRFPGCGVPARRTDLDHRVPFDHGDPARGGHTVRENLFCLCRFHHRAKTLGFWTYEHLGGGELEWTSPTGARHRTRPPDHGRVPLLS